MTSPARRGASWSGYSSDHGKHDQNISVGDVNQPAADLPALRSAVLSRPDSAARLLQRMLHNLPSFVDEGDRVDLMILLAEAHLYRRAAMAAFDAAGHAIHAAERLHPSDSWRRLCAYGVVTDAALHAGWQEVTACNAYLDRLFELGERSREPMRALYARAAYAVASYHEINAEHGHRLLTDLCEWAQNQHGRHHLITITLVAGLTAMQRNSSHSSARITGPRIPYEDTAPAPMPGGILNPDLDQPDPDYLAYRVRARPGCRGRDAGR